jgi:hypothetical protein
VNALLYWLRVGLAAFLAFAPLQARTEKNAYVANLETAHVLTDEMRDLVAGGMALDFELYCSLKTRRSDGGTPFSIKKIKRSIVFDYLRREFAVSQDGTELGAARDIEAAEKILKRYDGISFELPDDWSSAAFFAELRCLGNPLLEERFAKSGSSLWNGYRPSVKGEVSR